MSDPSPLPEGLDLAELLSEARIISGDAGNGLDGSERDALADLADAAETLLSELQTARAERDEARAWRAQFDTCMCGSLMIEHDWGSGHSPVSQYDHRLDQAEARATRTEADLSRALELLKRADLSLPDCYVNLHSEIAKFCASEVFTTLSEGEKEGSSQSQPCGAPKSAAPEAAPSVGSGPRSYQARVHNWMMACFGDAVAQDPVERSFRFLEEALELVQANDCTAEEAHRLVDYVYSRPVGERAQEVGGVAVCLAALCTAAGIDLESAAEAELARVWTKVETIRAKHASKPAGVRSSLPGSYPAESSAVDQLACEASNAARSAPEEHKYSISPSPLPEGQAELKRAQAEGSEFVPAPSPFAKIATVLSLLHRVETAERERDEALKQRNAARK